VARKRRHDDPAGSVRERGGEPGPRHAFGGRAARTLRVRRIHEREVHSECGGGGDPFDVGRLTVGRIRVELEVAGVKELPASRLDPDRRGVGHQMRHAVESEIERTRPNRLAPTRLDEPIERSPGFLEATPRKGEGERKPVDGRVTPLRQQGKRSDVIFVPVGQQDRVDLEALQRREVGSDPVDPGERLVRKRHARVDDDVRVAAGKPEHVASELSQTAERDEREIRSAAHRGAATAARASMRPASTT
jgi:hypothetical protein